MTQRQRRRHRRRRKHSKLAVALVVIFAVIATATLAAGSWVLSVVHNRAIDALRRHEARQSRDVVDETIAERLPARELTDAEAARREESRAVRGALEELPAEQRKVIELAYFGGFTHSQIAEMLGMPIGTVKGRMRLGLSKMRLSLLEEMAA